MATCFSFTSSRNSCYRYSFSHAGLRSSTHDLGDGTIIHSWIPKLHDQTKPTVVLLHGIGANAMWQWSDFIPPLISRFNVYVPDLIFFGDSYTTRPERSEAFQARCVTGLMEVHGVERMSLVGLSYGGFVAYSMAAQFPERVEKVVICGAGVSLEEKDMEEGLFKVKSIEEASSILLPQSPAKLRLLLKLAFHKPPKGVPSCFARDFIEVMCTDFVKEREELIRALHKDRKLSNLPKITQPTKVIWGEKDQVFPLELAYRLKSHLGEGVELVIIKKAGHAINMEKPKQMCKHMKRFLLDSLPPSTQKDHEKIESNAEKVLDVTKKLPVI